DESTMPENVEPVAYLDALDEFLSLIWVAVALLQDLGLETYGFQFRDSIPLKIRHICGLVAR
ncbi:hypothetical protein AVEN_85390-1, partial [Araneus ventricosus]